MVVGGGGGWVRTHNRVKPTLLVKVELGFDKKVSLKTHIMWKRVTSVMCNFTPKSKVTCDRCEYTSKRN